MPMRQRVRGKTLGRTPQVQGWAPGRRPQPLQRRMGEPARRKTLTQALPWRQAQAREQAPARTRRPAQARAQALLPFRTQAPARLPDRPQAQA